MPAHLLLFLAVLVRAPQSALATAWWWLLGKKLRARGRFMAAAARVPFNHQTWLKLNQPTSPVRPFRRISASADDGNEAALPFFAIHLHIPSRFDAGAVRDAIASIRRQSLPDWQLVITTHEDDTQKWRDFTDPRITVLPGWFKNRAAALAAVLNGVQAVYLITLDHDCTLTPGALDAYRTTVAGMTGFLPVLYADQDERGPRKERSNPWFKPQWDVDLFLAQDYLSAASAIPLKAVRQLGAIDLDCPDSEMGFSILARLFLSSDNPPAIVHVPYITVTCAADTWRRPSDARSQIIQALLGESGPSLCGLQDARVEPGPFGTLSIRYPLPLCGVSIIIPTRDKVDLLRTCLSGLLSKTSYPDFEVIVIDNGSVEPETLNYFHELIRDPRVRVLEWPHPYNYSAINNFAATQASKAYLCLLNNDTEILSAAWLGDMMRHAVRPGIGAVGARLLYPDRSIQHAGVVVGMGNAAGHAHRALSEGDPGYFAQAYVARGATAVTAACLVVSKEAFEKVGGLDEAGLRIAYNDIDLCLKLRATGLTNIYEPRAVLIHHESKSRGLDFSPEHLDRYMRELNLFQKRWQAIGFADPMHHPALDPASETYRAALIAPA